MVIFFFENLHTSYLSPIDGFWCIRFYVGAIWKPEIVKKAEKLLIITNCFFSKKQGDFEVDMVFFCFLKI